MTNSVISFLAMLSGSLLLDRTVRPRTGLILSWQGFLLHLLVLTAAFGFVLAGSGSVVVAGVLAIALMALFSTASNAKHAMLGEPLLFSDLALFAGLFRHPRFYWTAVSVIQRWALAIGALVLMTALALMFVPRLAPHLTGLGLSLAAIAALPILFKSRPFRALAQTPDVDADIGRHGLIATLLLYWVRWRETPHPAVCPAPAGQGGADAWPDLVVVVQCESFADPTELTDRAGLALPGLAFARTSAWQWGDLCVSGFGAYTMRTEYGVLFGRNEEALGFRRYDPFLTAHGETSYALSAKLGARGYHSSFVHPHDMRFYGRDRLMPAVGFDRLIGEESFPPVSPDSGRYVDDRTLGASLGDLIDKADEPSFLYAVTMENHGPWDKDRLSGSTGGLDAYLRHLRNSDAMLTDLIDRLSRAKRTALLVFFGDHRPSIPGVTEPAGARHTPYVMMRFDRDGRILTGDDRRVDLTPAELHHAILHCVQGARSGAETFETPAVVSSPAARG